MCSYISLDLLCLLFGLKFNKSFCLMFFYVRGIRRLYDKNGWFKERIDIGFYSLSLSLVTGYFEITLAYLA